ncbi:hypothetical protein EB796_019535 [Bugula neritina]|uniref:Hexosyltransferase n=1 Tax=Bugula neritina TaxID=10212 RepID=A0A7J7J7L5_BUGNE|nr:hypothetical protein EB796_019535 [Bugula neritina]
MKIQRFCGGLLLTALAAYLLLFMENSPTYEIWKSHYSKELSTINIQGIQVSPDQYSEKNKIRSLNSELKLSPLVVAKQQGESPSNQSDKSLDFLHASKDRPIVEYENVTTRFLIASKRFASIKWELFSSITYPGLDIHRRSWQFPITVPKCAPAAHNFVILIPSSPKNFVSRRAVRRTWGSPLEMKRLSSRIVFFVGLTNDTELQTRIISESQRLNDIVQIDMIDSYYNLTLKTIGMFIWASNYCKTVKYVAKIDDDNMVNLPNILHSLEVYSHKHTSFISGSLRVGTVPKGKSRWADPVFKPVYKESVYPLFFGGPAYFLTNNFIGRLVKECVNLPLIHLEDVFVNGICARQLVDVHKLPLAGMHMFPKNPCLFLTPKQTLMHKLSPRLLVSSWAKWHNNNTCNTTYTGKAL